MRYINPHLLFDVRLIGIIRLAVSKSRSGPTLLVPPHSTAPTGSDNVHCTKRHFEFISGISNHTTVFRQCLVTFLSNFTNVS